MRSYSLHVKLTLNHWSGMSIYPTNIRATIVASKKTGATCLLDWILDDGLCSSALLAHMTGYRCCLCVVLQPLCLARDEQIHISLIEVYTTRFLC